MATNTRATTRYDTGVGRTRYRRDAVETKPFYLTSEFMALVAFVVSLFIASIVVDDVDSRLAWILGTGLVGGYIVSRGIAKSGTRSSAHDPREDMLDMTRERNASIRD